MHFRSTLCNQGHFNFEMSKLKNDHLSYMAVKAEVTVRGETDLKIPRGTRCYW